MCEPHRLAVRVYYEDTDFSGVVYHANYLRFLERGRTEWLRDLGIVQAGLRSPSGEPLAFAVRQMTIDFRQPARMDDLLQIETSIAARAGARLDLAQAVRRGSDLLVTAQVQIVAIANSRPRRLPPELLARLTAGPDE